MSRRNTLLVLLILLHLGVATHSMWNSSVTFDEPDGAGVGRFLHETGHWDVTMARLQPPLTFFLQCPPFFLLDIPDDVWRVPHDGLVAYDDEIGRRILFGESGDPMTILRAARIPTLLMSAYLLAILFVWTDSFFGLAAAGIAGFIYALEPNVLASARLVTADLLTTLFFLAQLWSLDLLRRRFHWGLFLASAILAGAALSSRVNGLFMLPVGMLFLAVILKNSVSVFRYRLLAMAVYALLPFMMLWALYGFAVGSPLAAGGQGEVLAIALAPLPPPAAAVVRSLLEQPWPMPQYAAVWANMIAISRRGHPAFLLGEFRNTGWWYYFPVAFLIKTPLPLLLLFIYGIVRIVPAMSRFSIVLLVLPIVATVLPGMAGSLNYGFRHMLTSMPFLIIIAAGAAAALARTSRRWTMIVVALLFWFAIGAVRIHPSHLSYFNEIAGGAEGGEEWLSDSNIGWGEDYCRLAEYQRLHGIEIIAFAHYPIIPPEAYGVRYRKPSAPLSGIVAVEVMAQQFARRDPNSPLALLDHHKPIDRVGGSIKIYRIDPEF